MADQRMSTRQARWAVGDWILVVAPHGTILLSPEAPGTLDEDLWEQIHTDGVSLASVLDTLVMGAGGRLARIPDFGLVILGRDRVHLALRGGVVAEVDGARIDAEGVVTWYECRVASAESLALYAPGAADSAPARLHPVRDAVLPASAVHLSVAPSEAESVVSSASADSAEEPVLTVVEEDAEAAAAAAAMAAMVAAAAEIEEAARAAEEAEEAARTKAAAPAEDAEAAVEAAQAEDAAVAAQAEAVPAAEEASAVADVAQAEAAASAEEAEEAAPAGLAGGFARSAGSADDVAGGPSAPAGPSALSADVDAPPASAGPSVLSVDSAGSSAPAGPSALSAAPAAPSAPAGPLAPVVSPVSASSVPSASDDVFSVPSASPVSAASAVSADEPAPSPLSAPAAPPALSVPPTLFPPRVFATSPAASATSAASADESAQSKPSAPSPLSAPPAFFASRYATPPAGLAGGFARSAGSADDVAGGPSGPAGPSVLSVDSAGSSVPVGPSALSADVDAPSGPAGPPAPVVSPVSASSVPSASDDVFSVPSASPVSAASAGEPGPVAAPNDGPVSFAPRHAAPPAEPGEESAPSAPSAVDADDPTPVSGIIVPTDIPSPVEDSASTPQIIVDVDHPLAEPSSPAGTGDDDPDDTDAAPAGGSTGDEPQLVDADRVPRAGDHDGWTVAELPDELVNELGQTLTDSEPGVDRPVIDAPKESPTAPRTALSAICPEGHANPTNYVTCRECDRVLAQPARVIICPPLGRVRASTGKVVELDRPVLVGRAPAPSEVRGLEGSAPAVLTVPSPEQLVSRNHLLIELDEWSVLARNLSESNGTLLLREGEPARKIPSSEPVLLRAGDVLDLGDGQSLAMEDLP